jgi:3-hydroxybutyryl-CoA dehydrogenase
MHGESESKPGTALRRSMEIKKVGIVAMTGTMGTGIAQVCALAGYQGLGSSRSQDNINKALASINAQFTRNVEKQRMTQADKDAAVARIKGTTRMQDFADCDIVIEAAAEDMNLKKSIFAELDKVCKKDAIIASNTSCLSIMDLAVTTKRPDKIVGVHFFNPVPVMKLVEVVRTISSSDETVAASKKFCESVGKTVVIAKDAPGFIVNRLMTPFIINAVKMFENGVASREDIDTAINLGLNHPMGPLTLVDLIGIDTFVFFADAQYQEFKDPQFAVPVLLRKMVAAGWLGRKTKKGFYDYK